MYWIPSEFLQELPEEIKKITEEKFKGAKVILVVADGNYTETFYFGVNRYEANLLLDLGKEQILTGRANGSGRGPILD